MNEDFLALFSEKCITTEKIRELYQFPDYKYDKVIAVCMAVMVAAVFNPIMMIAFFIITSRLFYLAFLLSLIGVGIIFLLRKKFPLIVLGVIAALKLFPFREATSDTFIALAAVSIVYLLVRVRHEEPK
jgi:hypothetical protein